MVLDKIALLLAVIGGINWGLVGAFDLNILNIFSFAPIIVSILEIVIGLASCYALYLFFAKPETV